MSIYQPNLEKFRADVWRNDTGQFFFDETCKIERRTFRGNKSMWVNASKRDRKRFKKSVEAWNR